MVCESSIKVAICAALVDWMMSMALARQVQLDSSGMQRVAATHAKDPMAQAMYTGLAAFGGALLACAVLKTVQMGGGSTALE